MRRIALWVGLLLAAPAAAHENECPAGGVDGQQVAKSASTTESSGKEASSSYEQLIYWLACNATVATHEKDVNGAYNAYIVSLEDLGTCTAIDVTVGFRNEASGVIHTVGTLSLGTTSLLIPGPRGQRVVAVVNTMTGCGGDNADVRLDLLNERSNMRP